MISQLREWLSSDQKYVRASFLRLGSAPFCSEKPLTAIKAMVQFTDINVRTAVHAMCSVGCPCDIELSFTAGASLQLSLFIKVALNS